MTTITVYVRPAIEPYEISELIIEHISLVCNGITYQPVESGEVNDLLRYTFRVVTELDTTTPTIGVSVSDGLKVAENVR